MLTSPSFGSRSFASVRIACEKSASGISDGTEFLALPAVDAGVGDMGKPAQVEHRVGREETLADHRVGLFLNLSANGNTDRTIVDA